ncbi:acyl-coenzyme A:6-aminopenicillanic acid acyl-transferase-domain-containing protein [Xylariomycetidae sp. FL0641]|nr:acyl-coenzyme A:6-aminopenicillanic acid acyl-transferase-domain-containing protein [Xylariomycetidae sp. FL0641]
MLEIYCSGTPHEIGEAHGRLAKEKIHGSIAFYADLFRQTCDLSWPQVAHEASRYVEPLTQLTPRYVEEIRGIARGAALPFLSILALNLRTEIAFGLFRAPSSSSRNLENDAPPPPLGDGCTSVGLRTAHASFLAQNWDWMRAQAANLVLCHVAQEEEEGRRPAFKMLTEAGILGKVGLNAAGVGVCLNALRVRGVDPRRLPVHFALRACLEAPSRRAALQMIEELGVAGCGHILVADADGATGLECTAKWVKRVEMDEAGRVVHTNHLLLDKEGVEEPPWLDDSPVRLARMRELVGNLPPEPEMREVFELFKDTQGLPGAINRKEEGVSEAETLFTIVMELRSKEAQVTFGRPTEVKEMVRLAF